MKFIYSIGLLTFDLFFDDNYGKYLFKYLNNKMHAA